MATSSTSASTSERVPDAAAVRAARLRRQGLAAPLRSRRKFERLFRALQPVSTGAYARPGSPPRLVHRTHFDDAREADRLRRSRRIVKGRFQGGGVGYVHVEVLELYLERFLNSPIEAPGSSEP